MGIKNFETNFIDSKTCTDIPNNTFLDSINYAMILITTQVLLLIDFKGYQ